MAKNRRYSNLILKAGLRWACRSVEEVGMEHIKQTELETLSPAESSRLLKRALKDAFPGTKFSARLSRGTAYGNLHVSWTGGPDREAVEAVTIPFQSRSFDGMDDIPIAA